MKKLLLSIFFIVLATTPAYAGTFTDSAGHLYEDGIEFLASRGIVNGYDDGSFKPDAPINRAEMLKILIEGELILSNQSDSIIEPFATETCFVDVPPLVWFTKYVCAGKDRQIVVGYDGNIFLPAQNVTFVEAVKMAMETMYVPYLVTDDPWYRGPVNAASAGNYIPFTINAFDKTLTRGEMADMIARIIHKREDTLEGYLGDRQFIVVTYESIESSQDLSNTQIVPLPPEPEPMDTSTLAQYIEYSPEAFATLEEGQLAILNFHASWCPTCLQLDMELKDPEKLATLPSNLVIFKIDFDNSDDLRSQYGVIVQHTLVQVDLAGNEITKWIGGGIETINAELEL